MRKGKFTCGKRIRDRAPALLFFLCGLALYAQKPASPSYAGGVTGLPFIRNYPPGEYGAHNQNWAIVQDARGVMYFGNSRGLLEYDGATWRLIQTGNPRIIRSMAMSADNRIYAGGYGEMGYLAADAGKQLQYVSLLPEIDEQYRDFTDVWKTISAPGKGIYFITSKYLFLWGGQKMRVWPAQTDFQTGLFNQGRLYVHQKGLGLMQLVSDSLRLAPQGEQLADAQVGAMTPFGSPGTKKMLIATRNKGLLLYDEGAVRNFATEADDLFSRFQVFCATALTRGRYALGTMQNGVIIIDSLGSMLQHLHQATGLQSDAVLSLYEDRQRALWMGFQVGITRAETGGAISYLGEQDGLEGSVWEMVRHHGRLYAAGIMGLFYLDDRPSTPRKPARFAQVEGVSPQCWALLPFENTLLAGTFDGVYEISGDRGRRITDGFVFSLHRSRQDPNRVFAGMRGGVKSLYFQDGQWKEEGRLENLDYEVRHFFETPDGMLWLTDYFKGLVLVDLSKGYTRSPQATLFDERHGLPPPDRVVAFHTDKGLRFATLQGIFLFDASKSHFYRDSTLIQGLPRSDVGLFNATPDRRGNLWLLADDNAQSGLALRQSPGVYTWSQPLLRIAELPVFTTYPDPADANATWIGGTGRIIRYDASAPSNQELAFQTLIRQIVANGDSILFGGDGASPAQMLKLVFGLNSLRFRYAAPSFDDEAKNEYQYMLEGYDEDWSGWTLETYKDYTRLPPGEYRFMVRARNIYGQVGETAESAIHILPPFYRTVWAYLLYALLLALLVRRIWRLALRRIEKRHQQELRQVEYEKLKELDELKSRFFANISHEFRTPLTLILGPVENLLSSRPDPEKARNDYRLIQRNAQRLLRLINQVLDLSKLDAGKMQLDLRFADMLPLIKAMTFSFESLAESRKTRLIFESALESAWLYFDRDKMEQVFTNLLSNAFKFSPEEGVVKVSASIAANGEWLQIEVSDTGPGIREDQLPYLFDRFYQGAEASRTGEPGTGIGLALTKELVELHQGTISVESRVGEGARFTILLPYGEDAALPQVAEAAELSRENTLLLVEDNPDMRAYIRETLGAHYQVIEAADGQEGVELALERIPDIIISDVMMPRKDGLELCEALKNDERTSHIPIVLLTAKTSVESRLAGLERGADDYLAKPFNREELLLRVRNLLDSRRRLRERYASLLPPEPAEDRDVQIEDAFLQKIRGIVEERLSDSEFEIDQLARVVGMSRSQLFRKVKALTGQSPSLYIRAIRLHHGKVLLETTEMNVSEVAYEVGFSTPAYFSDAFMEAYGVRPSQVRG